MFSEILVNGVQRVALTVLQKGLGLSLNRHEIAFHV